MNEQLETCNSHLMIILIDMMLMTGIINEDVKNEALRSWTSGSMNHPCKRGHSTYCLHLSAIHSLMNEFINLIGTYRFCYLAKQIFSTAKPSQIILRWLTLTGWHAQVTVRVVDARWYTKQCQLKQSNAVFTMSIQSTALIV